MQQKEDLKKTRIEIIPAILPESFSHLEQEIDFVRKAIKLSAEYVQVDVVDGLFAPSKTWPYNGKSFDMWELLIDQKIGLPHWDIVNYEVDLLVKDQIKTAAEWISAGASRIIGHIEAFDKNFTNQVSLPEYTKMSEADDYKFDLNDEEISDFLKMKETFSIEVAMSLNPSTKISVIEPFLDQLDGVQFMGNDRVGFHGVELDEKVLETIAYLRKIRPEMPIGIDIGVNFKTLEILAKAGVTRFSSGSTILKSLDPRKTIADMINVINSQ